MRDENEKSGRIRLVPYTLIIFFSFLGFILTDGENLMYNSLIMPIVGIFGYLVFGLKSIYKIPILLLSVDVFLWLFRIVDQDIYSVFSLALIYSIFVFVGVVIAFLMRYALKKGNHNGKALKVTAFLIAFALICGVCLFADALLGNPISKALATNTAKKHIEKTYTGTDFVLNNVAYSFKDGYYHASVSSPSSIDTNFTLMINQLGKLEYDNYESRVLSGWSTASRVDAEYRNAVEKLVNSGSFPYSSDITFGELIFDTPDEEDGIDDREFALSTDELVMDAFYNASELGARAGKLTFYIEDDTVSHERMAEILLGIRKCFDEAGVGFCVIDCVLNPTQESDTGIQQIEVMEFRYSDIYEDGLVERVIEADNAAKEFYASTMK